MNDFLFKDEGYQLIGAALEVYNEQGHHQPFHPYNYDENCLTSTPLGGGARRFYATMKGKQRIGATNAVRMGFDGHEKPLEKHALFDRLL